MSLLNLLRNKSPQNGGRSTPTSQSSSIDLKVERSLEAPDEEDIWQSRNKYQDVPFARDASDVALLKGWIGKKRATWATTRKRRSGLDWAAEILPCFGWLRSYRFKSEGFLRDIVAGISIAGMLVPHGLSYAKQNGGLPAQYGLYNAFICVLIYSAFGSCRTLSVGPIAILYALVGFIAACHTVKSGLQDINPTYNKIRDPNKPIGQAQISAQAQFNDMCLQVAFMAGIVQLVAWALRLSFLLKFLSRSIMSGFTTAVAVIFTLSQLKSILGYATTSSNRVYLQLYYIFKNIGNFQWKEFVMGGSMLILLFGMQFLSQRFPRRLRYLKVFAPLTAMVLAIVITASARLDKHGIKIVGAIPRGLPPVTVNRLFPMQHFSKQFTTAIIAAAVSLLDQNAVGKAVAAKNNYRINSHQEFRAMGLANLIGSIFSCTTTSGNFSRTAVWTQIGGRTQLAGFIMAWIVALCLGVATAAFKYIPNNTLAAITIFGLSGLLEFSHLGFLWKVQQGFMLKGALQWALAIPIFLFWIIILVKIAKVSKGDFLVWNVAFWVACMHSVEVGLGASLGTSIALYVLRTMFGSLRQEGQSKDSEGNTIFHPIAQYKDAEILPEIRVYRLDTNIFFASVEDLHDELIDRTDELLLNGEQISFVVLDLTSSPYIDPTGIHFLQDIFQNLAKRNVDFLLANPQQSFLRVLQKAGFLSEQKTRRLFVSVADAVHFATEAVLRNTKANELALKV